MQWLAQWRTFSVKGDPRLTSESFASTWDAQGRLGSPRAPPPGLSHRAAGVPTRRCCGERGSDAAGPGALRRALGRRAAPHGKPAGGRAAAFSPGRDFRPAPPDLVSGRQRSLSRSSPARLRLPPFHGVYPEEAAGAAAAALFQGEVSARPRDSRRRRRRGERGSEAGAWSGRSGVAGRRAEGRTPVEPDTAAGAASTFGARARGSGWRPAAWSG